jgi:RNA polymerase sigma factor (TIGR02999 family)
MGEVTELLKRIRQNDQAALDELVTLVYPDLHRMARNRLAQNDTITLLDATSMVHEAYLRLQGSGRIDAQSRPQFFVYAAQVLRSVMVDFARKRRAERRGGGQANVTLSEELAAGLGGTDEDIERVNDALDDLAESDPRLKHVVEMRYFGGFNDQEIAEALGVTDRTVRRDWERAKMLLSVALKR